MCVYCEQVTRVSTMVYNYIYTHILKKVITFCEILKNLLDIYNQGIVY